MTNTAVKNNGYRIQEYLVSDLIDPTILDEVHRVVVAAWRTELPSVANWLEQQKRSEALDREVYLFTASIDDKIVGTARLTIHTGISDLSEAYLFEGLEKKLPVPIALIGRLGVLYDHR